MMGGAKAVVAALVLATLGTAANAQQPTLVLTGGGTTNPSKLYWFAMDNLMAYSRQPLLMTYRGIGSGNGIREFIGVNNSYTSFNDFGSGDVPMDSPGWNAWNNRSQAMVHVPIMVGPVGIFFNVPGVAGLNINACTLSRIFQGLITQWNDPVLQQQNPLVTLPAQQIIIFRRVSGSSSTFGLTNYLKQANLLKNAGNGQCQWNINAGTQSWNSTAPPAGFPNPWVAPAGSSFNVADGSDQMSNAISGTPYSIGYMEAGHGHALGLTEIALNNTDGNYLTSQTADLTAAVNAYTSYPSSPMSDWSAVSLLNAPGPNTWPITLITYIWAAVDMTGAGYKGPLLKAFLTYLLSAEGQAAVPVFEFTPLPPSLLATAQAAVAMIRTDPTQPAWQFESATQTTNATWISIGGGANPNTFSVNRVSYAVYQRRFNSLNITQLQTVTGALQTAVAAAPTQATVSALQAQVSSLQAMVAALTFNLTAVNAQSLAVSRQVAALAAPTPSTIVEKAVDSVKGFDTSVAAIVLAVVSLVLATLATVKAYSVAAAAAKYTPNAEL